MANLLLALLDDKGGVFQCSHRPARFADTLYFEWSKVIDALADLQYNDESTLRVLELQTLTPRIGLILREAENLRSRETMSRPSVRVGLCEWLAGKPVCYGANKVRAIEQILVLAAQRVLEGDASQLCMRCARRARRVCDEQARAESSGARGREAMNAFHLRRPEKPDVTEEEEDSDEVDGCLPVAPLSGDLRSRGRNGRNSS